VGQKITVVAGLNAIPDAPWWLAALALTGMVQANVGQKLLKSNILRVFTMSDFINI